MSLFPEEQKAQRRGITLVDSSLDLDAKGEHIIHPIGFLGTLNR